MSTETNSDSLKTEIKIALDETFGPLLLQIAKMIKEMSESIKSQQSVNDTFAAKLNLVYSLQTELQASMTNFTSIPDQFDKLDKNLAKFLQKSIQDSKKIQEQIDAISKKQIPEKIVTKEEIVQKEFTPFQVAVQQKEIPDLVHNLDEEFLKDLLAEFSKKEIYTTEALRLVETTRDKLLFERDDEIPYRAFAAKIFREILAIVKQEKDFRTISPIAAEDIRKHITNLLNHI